jgi:hypothetical protein
MGDKTIKCIDCHKDFIFTEGEKDTKPLKDARAVELKRRIIKVKEDSFPMYFCL